MDRGFVFISGATVGGLLGSWLQLNPAGLEFVMTALFVLIFLERWRKEEAHSNSLLGLGLSLFCLVLFRGTTFILPAVCLIFGALTLLRGHLEKAAGARG